MASVIDLDILRPEQKIIHLGGKDFDVSFIPCGITFDVDTIVQELAKIPQKKIASGGAECQKAFDLAVKLCSVFVKHHNPEMDEVWFKKNVDVVQINMFAKEIQLALASSYKGVADYGKK